jgi:hypothetical protein
VSGKWQQGNINQPVSGHACLPYPKPQSILTSM